jgi:protein SCO1/2
MSGETIRTPRPGALPAPPRGRRLGLQVAGLVAATAVTLGGLLAISGLVSHPTVSRATPTPPTYLLAEPRPAPALRLTAGGGQAFDLASLRGQGVLVFFGYTHCPDVCPATIGIVSQVLERVGPGVRAVFVSVDPGRDTPEWLADYLRFLPAGFEALTGSPAEIRETADAWGVRYARVDGDAADEYSMNHTASVYLVDTGGWLRAEFPFGTEAEPMAEVVREVLAGPVSSGAPTAAATATPTPEPTATTGAPASPGASSSATPDPTPLVTPSPTIPADGLRVAVVSSSVWARGASPVIFELYEGTGRVDDASTRVEVQLMGLNDAPVGARVPATAVRPPGVSELSYVAAVDIPTPGWWKLAITARRGSDIESATTSVAALDPGGTAALGAAAPTIATPILDDVAGDARQITTDPIPDLRLYRTSTSAALAAGQPFVLVVDSWRFRTTDACGRAIALGRFLLDRWPSVPIIHLEPFEYAIVSATPVLEGVLSDPRLVPGAAAWGLGAAPWSAVSMPWIFVVDGDGVVRAKYQGIIGSADIDVILAQLTAE